MPPPFPGMDPYLEHPALWPDVHNSLILALRDDLAPALRPRYYVAVEERTYVVEADELLLVGRSDAALVRPAPRDDARRSMANAPLRRGATIAPVPVILPLPDRIRETYLEVRSVERGEVVTAIELLSPSNKRPGEGRRLYEEKRLRILGTQTHLVEFDLLRAGEPMAMSPREIAASYRIVVSRAETRPRAELYAFGVREPIPAFPLPLQPGVAEPLVDLGRLLATVYDRAGYDLRIDYRADPVPPLEADDADWARALLSSRSMNPART